MALAAGPLRRRLAPAALLLAGLAACSDAPTMPPALQQLAGGEEWVAMRAPADLPRVETWMPYLDRSTAPGQQAAARVRELTRLADAARRQGQVERTGELVREAERVAVLALSRAPDERVLRRALGALDAWGQRVRDQVDTERAPQLARAADEVARARVAASAALTRGDTTGAVLHISAAAEQIRAYTPAEVALRVLARAEERLRTGAVQGPRVERALHLLDSARQELIGGDPGRALQRALYALQLAEGAEMHDAPREPDPACPDWQC